MLTAILVGLRDFFLAMALAWVGVTLETRVANETTACAADAQACAERER